MTPLRLVIDTNILVSAALKPDGLQRTVFVLAIKKPARLYVTEAILNEYRDVLARPELRSARACASNFFNSSGTTRRLSGRYGRCVSRGTRATISFWSALTPLAPTTF